MRIQTSIPLLVVVLMGLGESALAGRTTSVAVCDVQVTFASLKEKAQIEADIQTQKQRLQQEKQKREQEIRQLQSDLEILSPDTPAYDQKQQELEQKSIRFQAWAAFQNKKLNRVRALQVEKIYKHMIDAIGRVAQENGYDLVLYKEGAVKFRGAKPEQLSGLIQIRKVLWSAEDLEITELVVTTMNNEFVNQR